MSRVRQPANKDAEKPLPHEPDRDVVFGIRLPRALTAAFIDKALRASEGIAGLSVAMRGLIAAQTAVMAVAAIDGDMRRMARASAHVWNDRYLPTPDGRNRRIALKNPAL